eukprot:CAMPEP_0117594160 /NCGR_PEP_ID=MMETSP0784-20121206/73042_1 /TAXON_ID=39447 /ORGANISM="" /LENGTH=97 /DNA_ID=CAMNT_0005396179 /DNA_START=778 /DNA_END=1068 /DNA_ORIENTATION=+
MRPKVWPPPVSGNRYTREGEKRDCFWTSPMRTDRNVSFGAVCPGSVSIRNSIAAAMAAEAAALKYKSAARAQRAAAALAAQRGEVVPKPQTIQKRGP